MPGKIDIRNNDFDFYGNGVSGVATKNTTTDFDLKVDKEECYCSGGEIIVKDAEHGDYIEIQVVDVDNIFGYGAGTVLATYLKKWFVDYRGKNVLEVPYAGYIYKNLYLRLKYTSVSSIQDVKVAINYSFHLQKL